MSKLSPEWDFYLGMLIFILTVAFLLFGIYFLASGTETPETSDYEASGTSLPMIQSNTIVAITPYYYPRTNIMGNVIEDYYYLIDQYSWDSDIAYNIMICESRGNSEVHNFNHATKDDSWGLFQINLYGELAYSRPSSSWLMIPENNVEYAYQIYQNEGWNAWRKCARMLNIL